MDNTQLIGASMSHDSLAPMLVGSSGSILLIAIILLFARLWSRTRPVYNLGLEDWTVVGATVRQFHAPSTTLFCKVSDTERNN